MGDSNDRPVPTWPRLSEILVDLNYVDIHGVAVTIGPDCVNVETESGPWTYLDGVPEVDWEATWRANPEMNGDTVVLYGGTILTFVIHPLLGPPGMWFVHLDDLCVTDLRERAGLPKEES